MVNRWYDFRLWLIELLAGDMTIVINAHFKDGGLVVEGHALIQNVTLELEAKNGVALNVNQPI